MKINSKKDIVFIILAAFFITNAITAELIGGKLIQIGGTFTMSLGILPWPIVFLATDLINEYFGKEGVKKLSFITAGMIVYAFILVFGGMVIPAVSFSPVSDGAYKEVFGQSLWIIVGSVVAFISSQILDVFIFWLVRERTGKGMIWLRATGSTAISQLVDTFIVLGIAFWLPGKINTSQFITIGLTGYLCKLIIAVLLTPLIYLGHSMIDRFIGEKEVDKIIHDSAEQSLHHPVKE
jgi:queuosine precursor transporter